MDNLLVGAGDYLLVKGGGESIWIMDGLQGARCCRLGLLSALVGAVYGSQAFHWRGPLDKVVVGRLQSNRLGSPGLCGCAEIHACLGLLTRHEHVQAQLILGVHIIDHLLCDALPNCIGVDQAVILGRQLTLEVPNKSG